jgi:alpha-amylase
MAYRSKMTGMRRAALGVAFALLLSGCSNRAVSKVATGVALDQNIWWRDGVCYEVFVRSFYDSDGDGIGDLRGLTARLNYINDGNPASTHSLGANCIWLMPIDKSMSYHGYDVVDYYHVDPRYGTDDDFRNLVTEAHKRGIHVIVDFVPNHTGSQNPWFQAALHDPRSPYRDWYRWSNTLPSQKGPWGQEAWHKSLVRDEYYYGVFWHEMPDLNYENPSVRAEMQKVLTYWLKEMHVDGFRFDAIPYLVEEGDQLEHTRGTHDVLRQLGNAVRATAPESFTIGEESDIDALPTYYPDQLDSYFEFAVAHGILDAARTGEVFAFTNAIQRPSTRRWEGRWSPFLTNHDQPRVMTVLGDVARARVAASAMLMLPGMPFIYYGEEIGMLGNKPDETIRTPMQWGAAANGGFTIRTPWEALQPDWRTKNVAAQDGDAGSLLNHYRRLIRLRNAHVALRRGRVIMASTYDAAYRTTAAFMRSDPAETVFVVLNFGNVAVRNFRATLASVPASYRLQLLFADPLDGCTGAGTTGLGSAVTIQALAAHGVCVFELVSL